MVSKVSANPELVEPAFEQKSNDFQQAITKKNDTRVLDFESRHAFDRCKYLGLSLYFASFLSLDCKKEDKGNHNLLYFQVFIPLPDG